MKFYKFWIDTLFPGVMFTLCVVVTFSSLKDLSNPDLLPLHGFFRFLIAVGILGAFLLLVLAIRNEVRNVLEEMLKRKGEENNKK